MVAIFLLIDFIILLAWQLVDPLTSKVEYMTLKVNTLMSISRPEIQMAKNFIPRMYGAARIKLIATGNNFIQATEEKRLFNVKEDLKPFCLILSLL